MKNRKHFKKLLCVMMAAAMLLSVSVPALAAESSAEDERIPMKIEKLEDEGGTQRREDRKLDSSGALRPEADPNEMVRVSIVLESPSTLEAGYAPATIAATPSAIAYRNTLETEQAQVQTVIEDKVLDGGHLDVVWNMTLAANIISANVKRGDMEKIAALPGVESVVEEMRYYPQVIDAGGELQPNMAISGTMNGAQETWDTGYTGAGSKIAIIDTGIAIDHRSFDPDAFQHSIDEVNKAREEKGLAPIQLMDEDYIDEYLDQLNITKSIDQDITAQDLYKNAKVPFGFNYVDKNAEYITHDNDSEGEHGSHVAGIAAANKYVVEDGKYVEALDAVKVAGDAPDAQLMIMKVFGQGGGAYDSDYMVAIEDAMILGADSINLSLGSGMAGYATPSDTYKTILDNLEKNGSVVIMSACNSGAWGENTYNKQLYSDGVNFDTTGSPGSYKNAFTVASVDNDGMISPSIDVAGSKFGFTDTSASYEIPGFDTLDTLGTGTQYEFIMLDVATAGFEDAAVDALDTLGVDFTGKIIVFHRGGGTSFSDKAIAGFLSGADGVIVANNQGGTINMDLSDYVDLLGPYVAFAIPVISILQADGNAMYAAFKETEEKFTYYDDDMETVTAHYVTGTLTVSKSASIMGHVGKPPYTMSSFSSWGVPGDLSLKPEITAPGGNIYSVNGLTDDEYELMSGTSMAAPQVAGLAALVQQYLRDKNISVAGLNSRALTQSLLMSTAKPLKDASNNFYSLFQQGAGLADANAAVTTPVVITVDGQEDGKVKVELGDDPAKNGVYTFTFTLYNLTDTERFYDLSADVFSQAINSNFLFTSTTAMNADVTFSGDDLLPGPMEDGANDTRYDFDKNGKTNRADAQWLLSMLAQGNTISNENADLDLNGVVNTHDVHMLLAMLGEAVAVPAGGSTTVTATITLDKATWDAYPEGAYVEAYISAEPYATEEGEIVPTLSIPVLGFYGNWTDSSMFDFKYEDLINEQETRPPYLYEYTSGVSNVLAVEEDDGLYVLLNDDAVGENGLDGYFYLYSLIRNAGNGVIQVTNHETGDLIWRSADLGSEYAAYYYVNSQGQGEWRYFQSDIDIGWDMKDMNGEPVPNGTVIDLSLVMAPEYYADENGNYDWDALTNGDVTDGELGHGAYLTTTLLVDTEDPTIVNALYSTVKGNEKNIFATVMDNASVVDITLWGADGEDLAYEYNPTVYASTDDCDDGIPNFTPTDPGEQYMAVFDGYYGLNYTYLLFYGEVVLDNYIGPLTEDVYRIEVRDIAGNTSVYRLFAGVEPAEHAESITLNASSGTVMKGSKVQLEATVLPITLEDRGATWSSSDENVLTVDQNGLVTAVGKGTATITATAKVKGLETAEDGTETEVDLTAQCEITVETLPITMHGVLGDEEGYGKMFTWDYDNGELEYTHGEDDQVINPVAVTEFRDGQFYNIDINGNTYILSEDGQETIESAMGAFADNLPYDITWTEKSGFSYTEGNWMYPGDDPMSPAFSGFNLTSYARQYGNLYAIAAEDEHWEETTDEGEVSGDYLIWVLTDAGYMWKFMINEDSASMSLFPLTRTGFNWSFEGDGGNTFSNMVIGEDGNFYISIMRNNTNELVKLELEEGEGTSFSFAITELGDFGEDIWPALLLNVTDNEAQQGSEGEDGQAVYAGTDTFVTLNENVELTSFVPETNEVDDAEPEIMKPVIKEPIFGSLNSISSSDEDSGETGGINVDTDNYTVTVPIVADDTTNGLVKLDYDGDVLEFETITGGTVLMSSYHNEANHSITVAFADGEIIDGEVIASAVFSYNPSYSVQTAALKMTVEEDGEVDEIDEEDQPVIPEVEIPALTPPAPPAPPTPTEPDVPSDPGKEEEDKPVRVPETFEDLSSDTWYFEYVKEMLADGYFGGVSETRFAPEAFLERGMAAVILHRIDEEPEVTDPAVFTDVATTDYFAKAVDWASSVKVILGVGDDLYEPTRNVTRQELVVMLWRYAQLQGYDVRTDGTVIPETFVDRDSIASWAGEAVCWAYREGILLGKDGNRLDPKGDITRAEASAVFSRFLALDPDKDKAEA